MSRLPPALQPLWPAAKVLHRLGARTGCALGRPASALFGERRLPRRAYVTPGAAAAGEPDRVRRHVSGLAEQVRRTPPAGPAAQRWVFAGASRADLPAPYTLEIEHGTVVGDYGAVITPAGVLDFPTSPYFGIRSWREHPIFLRTRLPHLEEVDGSLLVLATRGGSVNYYHFLLDVLPRLAVLGSTLPGADVDAVYLPCATGYQRELIELVGLTGPEAPAVVATGKHRTVRAGTLLVPSMPNPDELAPRWLVEWVRERLPSRETAGRPRRLYVTRGSGRNTRRLDGEARLWPALAERGFARIDPGALSVREQIDHFAAAEVVVGIHGAALTNLVFCPAGVRVLELFAPGYVKHCYWSILDSIPGSDYRYLVGEGRTVPEGGWMRGLQDDVRLPADRVLAEVDAMLA